MNDGVVLVHGPTSDGNGALDANGSLEVNGGLLVAAGSSGMAEAPESSSIRMPSMSGSPGINGGTLFHLESGDGTEVITFAPSSPTNRWWCSPGSGDAKLIQLYTGGKPHGARKPGAATERAPTTPAPCEPPSPYPAPHLHPLSRKTILVRLSLYFVRLSLRARGTRPGNSKAAWDWSCAPGPPTTFRLHIAPEVRLGEDFRVDNFHVEGGLEYEPLRGLDLGASYRFLVNPRETKSTEYVNRYALFASYAREIRRWEPSLRVKYTNDSDDAGGTYPRYRPPSNTTSKGVRFTPSVSLEGFHALEENNRTMAHGRWGAASNHRARLSGSNTTWIITFTNTATATSWNWATATVFNGAFLLSLRGRYDPQSIPVTSPPARPTGTPLRSERTETT
ncbi:MAG: hypothetical protein R2751_14500 [Bacteroidales bacterium]